MKQYRAKLKIDTMITAVVSLALLTVSILAFANELGVIDLFTPVAGDSHWYSRWNGFIVGASVGLLIYMVIAIIRNIRAFRNDQKLKELYIKENDERTAEIIKSAQEGAYRTLLFVELAAVIIAGYFNITVSLTILACLWLGALLGPAYKSHFSKKI